MVSSSEKFCLKWNDFEPNMVSSFRELRTDTEFSDVTLVCEEDQQVEAHKIILKSCSPFFSKVLAKNKHSHPMIYMRGLKASNLMAIVDFIYLGEANIFQEDLDGFLALAEELQLKGLTGSPSDKNETSEGQNEVPKESNRIQTEHLANGYTEKKVNLDTLRQEYKTNILETNQLVTFDNQILLSEDMTRDELEAKKISLMEKVEEGIGAWRCTVCGKTAKTKQDIKRHIETHLEGLSYSCNQCGKVSRSSNALNTHVSTFHRN